jgi:hypothetical protein
VKGMAVSVVINGFSLKQGLEKVARMGRASVPSTCYNTGPSYIDCPPLPPVLFIEYRLKTPCIPRL